MSGAGINSVKGIVELTGFIKLHWIGVAESKVPEKAVNFWGGGGSRTDDSSNSDYGSKNCPHVTGVLRKGCHHYTTSPPSTQLPRPPEYQIMRMPHCYHFGLRSAWRFRDIMKVMQSHDRGYGSDMEVLNVGFSCKSLVLCSSSNIYLSLSFSFLNFIQYIYSPVHTREQVELYSSPQNLITTQISDFVFRPQYCVIS